MSLPLCPIPAISTQLLPKLLFEKSTENPPTSIRPMECMVRAKAEAFKFFSLQCFRASTIVLAEIYLSSCSLCQTGCRLNHAASG